MASAAWSVGTGGAGESVAAKFLDSLVKKGNDAWAYTSLHNNRAGRLVSLGARRLATTTSLQTKLNETNLVLFAAPQAVRDSLQKHCKCHGVSGSCSLQTCWMAVPSFSRVAAALRRQYDHAVRIDFEAGHGKLVLGNSASGLVQRSAWNRPSCPAVLSLPAASCPRVRPAGSPLR